jgi:hypothetical protein
VFGSAGPFPATLELASLDGTNGFVVNGIDEYDACGTSVSGAGDVSGDGIDDVIIGAAAAGQSYVVLGRTDGFAGTLEAIDLNGTNGYLINGSGDSCGWSVSGGGDVDADGIDDVVVGAVNAGPNGEMDAGATYVVFGRMSCMLGRANLGNGFLTDNLYLQGSTGGSDRTVEVSEGDLVSLTVLKPIGGGTGKFVIHADVGSPNRWTVTDLPFEVGEICFPFLLSDGASPVIIANSIGKRSWVGESHFFGVPMEDPEPATAVILYPALPLGMVLTFQGIIVDPGSSGSRPGSTTNAVILKVL